MELPHARHVDPTWAEALAKACDDLLDTEWDIRPLAVVLANRSTVETARDLLDIASALRARYMGDGNIHDMLAVQITELFHGPIGVADPEIDELLATITPTGHLEHNPDHEPGSSLLEALSTAAILARLGQIVFALSAMAAASDYDTRPGDLIRDVCGLLPHHDDR